MGLCGFNRSKRKKWDAEKKAKEMEVVETELLEEAKEAEEGTTQIDTEPKSVTVPEPEVDEKPEAKEPEVDEKPEGPVDPAPLTEGMIVTPEVLENQHSRNELIDMIPEDFIIPDWAENVTSIYRLKKHELACAILGVTPDKEESKNEENETKKTVGPETTGSDTQGN